MKVTVDYHSLVKVIDSLVSYLKWNLAGNKNKQKIIARVPGRGEGQPDHKLIKKVFLNNL